MILLDTNVVSEMMKPEPAARVVSWMEREPASSLYVTSITQAEIMHGVMLLPQGRRRGRPIAAFEAQIAAIARAAGATLATRNITDFDDCAIRVVNPWK